MNPRQTEEATQLRAYVSGALTGEIGSGRVMYEQAAALLTQCGFVPYVPHLATDPMKHARVTPEEVYRTDRTQVATADLVVAFLGVPSVGVGQELEIAGAALVPVLLVAPVDQPVSRMALGGVARKYGPIRYRAWTDLELQLRELLPTIASELRGRRPVLVPSVADPLRRGRLRMGLSRTELGRRLGVSEAYIQIIETLDSLTANPSLRFLSGAAAALGTTLPALLGATGSGETPLLQSLREFAASDGLSYRNYRELETIAARGLEPSAWLSAERWRELSEARARAVAGVEQLELPHDKA